MTFDETGDLDPTPDPALIADGIDRDRRRLLAGLAATAAASQIPGRASAQSATATGGVDDFSDIKHVIVLMMENAIYSVISPESCAAIIWRDAGKAELAANALRLTARDLLELGLIDEIGRAHV